MANVQTIFVACVAVAVSQFTADGQGSVSSQYHWHQYMPGNGASNEQYNWNHFTEHNNWHQYAPNRNASTGSEFDWHRYTHPGRASGEQTFNWQQFVPQGHFSGGQFDWQEYANRYSQSHIHPWDYYVRTYGNNYSVRYSNAWRDVTLDTTHIWQNNASDAHNATQLCSFYAHQTAVLQAFTPAPFQHWGRDNLGKAILTNLARLHRESNGTIDVANCSGTLFNWADADRQYRGPQDAGDASSEGELNVWQEHAKANIRSFVPSSFQNVSMADIASEYQQNRDRINGVDAPVAVAAATDVPIAANVVTAAPVVVTVANAFLSESPVKQPAIPMILMLALLAGVAVSAITVGSRQRRGNVASEPLLPSEYTALP